MSFLQALGIDFKLLVAQILNFGLLLLILSKFLYKPILKRIRQDEQELKALEKEKEEIEKEKTSFIENKKANIQKAKDQAKNIISEAESISKTIEKNAKDKTKKDIYTMIEQSRSRLISINKQANSDIINKAKQTILKDFKSNLKSNLTNLDKLKFEITLWESLIKRIDLYDGIKPINLSKLGVKNVKDKNIKETLEKMATKKFEPIKLVYSNILTKEQTKKLEKLLLIKTKYPINITYIQNDNLICGYRFEIAGVIFESNFLNLLSYEK